MSAQRTVSIVVVALLLATGCEWWRTRGRKARVEQAVAAAAEQIPNVALVAVPAIGPPSERPSPLLVVTPSALHVDNSTWLHWLHTSGNAFVTGIEAEELGDLVVLKTGLALSSKKSGVELVRPLLEALTDVSDVEKRVGEYSDYSGGGDLELRVDANVTLQQLASVMYTLGQVGYARYHVAAIADGKPGAVLVKPVPIGGGGGGLLGGGESKPCVMPFLVLQQAGIQVRVQRGLLSPRGMLGVIGARGARRPPELGGKPDPTVGQQDDWHGRVVLDEQRACPSVPRKGTSQDLETLVSLLRAMTRSVPACFYAYLGGEPQTRWAEVAPALSAMSLQAGFVDPVLTVGEEPDAPDCSKAIVAGAIVPP